MAVEITERELLLSTGDKIREISLSNGLLKIVVHNFGARLFQLFAPDRYGKLKNILLSRDDPDTYVSDGGYYGVICGPVAGRIAGASFDGINIKANEGRNLLHSGDLGWERQFWNAETYQEGARAAVRLSLKDERSGFPGPIEAEVVYELSDTTLTVQMSGYTLGTDTVFNPAFHPYFNLTADKSSTLDHLLQASVDRWVEPDEENIPTGRLLSVKDTVYDLRQPMSVRQILQEQPTGFDHCLIFEKGKSAHLTLSDPESGRRLDCETDREAVVIYTATNPEQNSTIAGAKMTPNRGIAIEFQELPDIVHHPEWGSISLQSGKKKSFVSSYQFSVEN